jgi:hypothetical protein
MAPDKNKQYTDEQIRILKEELEINLATRLDENREQLSADLHQQNLLLEARINYKQDSTEKRLDEISDQMKMITEALCRMEKGKGAETGTSGTSGTSGVRVIPVQPEVVNHPASTNTGVCFVPVERPPPTPPIGLTNLNPNSEAYYPENHHYQANTHYLQPPATHNYQNFQTYAPYQDHIPNMPLPQPIFPNPPRNMNYQNKRKPYNQQQLVPTPKLEIPSFSGTNPRGWIHKCERDFRIFHVQEVVRQSTIGHNAYAWLRRKLVRRSSNR